MRQPDGRIVKWFGTCTDIEDQKRATYARYRSLVEMSPDAMALRRGDSFAYVNQATVRLLGAKSADQLLGATSRIVIGTGILGGAAPGMFYYFNAKNGWPAITWYASVMALYLLGLWWLFFRRGAETLAEHPGLFNHEMSADAIRTFYLITSIGSIAFSVMFFFFPAGLVLYWITNNALSILQQWFINKRLGALGMK